MRKLSAETLIFPGVTVEIRTEVILISKPVFITQHGEEILRSYHSFCGPCGSISIGSTSILLF